MSACSTFALQASLADFEAELFFYLLEPVHIEVKPSSQIVHEVDHRLGRTPVCGELGSWLLGITTPLNTIAEPLLLTNPKLKKGGTQNEITRVSSCCADCLNSAFVKRVRESIEGNPKFVLPHWQTRRVRL